MNYVKDVLKLFGIEPFDLFFISDKNNFSDGTVYCFDENFVLREMRKKTICEKYRLEDFILGKNNIVKISSPNITKEEKIAVDYAKACGCKWIVKEAEGSVFAYEKKPIRTHREWLAGKDDYDPKVIEIHIPISFINWSDSEPYYIGD